LRFGGISVIAGEATLCIDMAVAPVGPNLCEPQSNLCEPQQYRDAAWADVIGIARGWKIKPFVGLVQKQAWVADPIVRQSRTS
jgi:hypothetical protein